MVEHITWLFKLFFDLCFMSQQLVYSTRETGDTLVSRPHTVVLHS